MSATPRLRVNYTDTGSWPDGYWYWEVRGPLGFINDGVADDGETARAHGLSALTHALHVERIKDRIS